VEVRPGVRRAGVGMVRIDFNRLRFLVIDDTADMRRPRTAASSKAG
jgi:hypothetical protein